MLLLCFFWDLESPQPCYISLYSPCTPNRSSFHTPLRHWTCEPCTAFWRRIDRCGLPGPHSKLGKSKPVQIWKSCICTDLSTWAEPWATPATQIPEVGGIQLAWKASEANMSVCTCPGQYIWVNSIIIRKIRLGQGLGRSSYNIQSGVSHRGYQSSIWLHPQTYQAPPEDNLGCVCMLYS